MSVVKGLEKEAIEALAKLSHEQWSGWMIYLFMQCEMNEDGTGTIPKWAIERWGRQMLTAYENLSEEEKESDRREALKVLAIIERSALFN